MKMKLRILALVALLFATAAIADEDLPQTCSWTSIEKDPSLKEMIYDVGDGPKPFQAYVEPPLESFYKGDPPSKTRVVPKFNGLAGKFVNMSNKNLNFYWESAVGGAVHLMRHYKPFSTGGTGTFPGHRFFFSPDNDPDTRVKEFVVGEYPQNYYVYDPYFVEGDPVQTEKNLKANLNKKERKQYDKWRKTLLFNEQYLNFTGRSYLANYLDDGPRKAPSHFMWPADYFGQEHWVVTKETHFDRLPPSDDLDPILITGTKRVLKDGDPRILQEYRVKDEPYMNMTLKVLSVIPRVFEIQNFLSPTEIDHILDLAGGIELHESTTGDVGTDRGSDRTKGLERKTKTRTSKNSWVPREKSPIIDAIYRRAADLTRIDEALLRSRDKDEHPEVPTKRKVCEELQLVHYGPEQEYTAHHDFGHTHIDDNLAGARFATILFYLNEGMEGGHTSFPRYVNGESFHELAVKPEAGKAVLFYSQLPDGNMDDFSQHAAKPIIEGEKWLINLWIWDPVKDTEDE
ncbi:2OG-Fe(II) oxygenase superfamily-domain containing protein [Nitzschia inconspicua]|uniref:2OG-Fe(II) oxygenase superfamily-domain containing protein n=1 Tax=Nitzschia inconspicua TaxID=303405 RepID=A0A9K3M0E4_9STRA|nr:2OG-Fe(II) oxygenase superfamily-domain containing protein [Nitzschia inconspicua]